MLKSGAEVDKTDRQGLTSLALAVQEGHVGPMRMLLAHGADVDRCNENGTVPLFLAAGAGDELGGAAGEGRETGIVSIGVVFRCLMELMANLINPAIRVRRKRGDR